MLGTKALTKSVLVTDAELEEVLEVFSRPDTAEWGGRLFAIDHVERLVMIRRAVRAGFFNEGITGQLALPKPQREAPWIGWTNYCTGCVPCAGVERCGCDCHSYAEVEAA